MGLLDSGHPASPFRKTESPLLHPYPPRKRARNPGGVLAMMTLEGLKSSAYGGVPTIYAMLRDEVRCVLFPGYDMRD